VDADSGIGLGHRRLSIVDLSAEGNQPMRSACRRYVVSYNGEIYNFLELRQELESRSHAFRGRSDTEVLLAAITEWGVQDALTRFNGMFSFALWDAETRTLTLARDRVGEKPLYYGTFGSALVFASEVRALHAFEGFPGEVDRDALAVYLRDLCIPTPYSIYRGVQKLPAGSLLTVGSNGVPLVRTYWSAREVAERALEAPFRGSFDDAIAEVDRAARRAVKLRMLADVPLGAFLSGGLDSTTVVALMQAQSDRPVRTFSIGVADARYDEAPIARAVARHLGTEHTEFYVSPQEVMETVPTAAAAYDEPFADSSQIPTLLVSRLARAHVTVALTGDGGDELFAGYERYETVPRMWSALRFVPGTTRGAVARGIRAAPAIVELVAAGARRIRRKTRVETFGSTAERIATLLEVRSLEGLYERLTTQWKDPASIVLGTSAEVGARSVVESLTTRDARQRLMYRDLVRYLPEDLLVKVDRASMSVSLESRIPMLDPDLIALAWRLPMSMKLGHGKTKRVLRHLLYRYVPPEYIDRPKMGFSIPVGQWIAGPLRDWAEALLDERQLREDGYFDVARVRAAWKQHLSLEQGWSHHVWIILMFQSWLENHRRSRATRVLENTG